MMMSMPGGRGRRGRDGTGIGLVAHGNEIKSHFSCKPDQTKRQEGASGSRQVRKESLRSSSSEQLDKPIYIVFTRENQLSSSLQGKQT
jgi:hypothetical protein